MKKLFSNQWLGMAAGCLLALPVPQLARADADDKPAPKPVSESPVKRNANGEMVVTIDDATQKLIKLEFTHPVVAEWQPVVTGYGRVVDPAPLIAAATDLATAQATADGSEKEYARLKTLAAQNNASMRALETAQLAAQNDHLALAAARAKFAGDWGSALTGRADLSTLIQQLGERKQSLVRLTLPAGENLAEPPAATALTVFPDDAHLIPAELLDGGLGVAGFGRPAARGAGLGIRADGAGGLYPPGSSPRPADRNGLVCNGWFLGHECGGECRGANGAVDRVEQRSV
jgi:hypothetical protein